MATNESGTELPASDTLSRMISPEKLEPSPNVSDAVAPRSVAPGPGGESGDMPVHPVQPVEPTPRVVEPESTRTAKSCDPMIAGATYPAVAHPVRGTLGTEDGGSVVVGPPGEGIDVVLLAPAIVVVVVLVVATPAHVASPEQASDVVNRPSAAPQAVPFLHTAGVPTIDAFTLPFFLSVQHTAAFGFPQMDALSHRSTSARQRLSGSRFVTLGSFSELLTHLLYRWC